MVVDDLVQWLRAQLDEDERIARAAREAEFCKDGHWVVKGPFEGTLGSVHSAAGEAVLGEEESVPFAMARYVAAHDPARVLREIDTKRQIVERYAWLCEHGDTGGTAWVLPLLALPYVDRPGYQESWRP